MLGRCYAVAAALGAGRPAFLADTSTRLLVTSRPATSLKDAAAAAASKLSEAVQGVSGASIREDADSTADPQSASRDEVPHSEHSEKLFAGGAEVPDLMPEETFAGGLDRLDHQAQEAAVDPDQTFQDADPAQAAEVPQQPYGLEAEFEDSSFKRV